MKPDSSWPPPPLPHPSEVLPADLPPPRLLAVAQLSLFAQLAESRLVPGETLLPDDAPYRSPLAFVAATLTDFIARSPSAPTLAAPDLDALRAAASADLAEKLKRPTLAPLNARLLARWARDNEASPHVMLIDVPRTRGISGLGPLRGDIALFADGHCAIVTKTMCRGCQHFEAVEFTPESQPDQPPTIRLRTHWSSTITHLIRLVIEAPVGVELVTAEEPAKKLRKPKADEPPASA